MRIVNEPKLDFKDVLIQPKWSEVGSRAEVDVLRIFKKINREVCPIIAANMDTVGTFAMARELAKYDCMTALHKFYSSSELIGFFESLCGDEDFIFYTTGVTDKDISKLKVVAHEFPLKNVCVDVSNGYTKFFQDRCKEIRSIIPNAVLMVGNVVTPEMTQALIIDCKVDIVKIGIGPGAQCTTRKMTGVGYPQLSAVIECADVAHGLNALICSDGGCKDSGDVVKAFGAGTDFVMLGTMLAGHDECDGEWIYEPAVTNHGGIPRYDGTRIKTGMKFYGMSSKEAQEKYNGGVADYKAAEGRSTIVDYKGPVSETIKEIRGGIRGGCSMVGAMRLKDLSKCTTFVRIT